MGTNVERQSGGFMNGDAVWLTCRDCGHTSRVLAVMAGRVLKTRAQCPQCASTAVPCLNSTPIGSTISLSEEQSAALREMDDPALHALATQHASTLPLHWMRDLQSRIVHRFTSHRRHGPHATRVRGEANWYGTKGNENFHPAAGTIRPTGTAVRL